MLKLYIKTQDCSACELVKNWIKENRPELMEQITLIDKDQDNSYKLYNEKATVPFLVEEWSYTMGSENIIARLKSLK